MKEKTTNTSALQIVEASNEVNDKLSLSSESISVQTSGGKIQVSCADKPGKKTGSSTFSVDRNVAERLH